MSLPEKTLNPEPPLVFDRDVFFPRAVEQSESALEGRDALRERFVKNMHGQGDSVSSPKFTPDRVPNGDDMGGWSKKNYFLYITPRFPEWDSLWFKRFWTSCQMGRRSGPNSHIIK